MQDIYLGRGGLRSNWGGPDAEVVQEGDKWTVSLPEGTGMLCLVSKSNETIKILHYPRTWTGGDLPDGRSDMTMFAARKVKTSAMR